MASLSLKGAHVLVHCGKNKAGAEDTLREVEKVSGGVFQADLMPREDITALFKEIRSTTSIGRFVTAEEVAHAGVFIAENDALVGQVLTLDGGTSLKVLP